MNELSHVLKTRRKKLLYKMKRRIRNNCKPFNIKLRQTRNCKINERMKTKKKRQQQSGAKKETSKRETLNLIFFTNVYTHTGTHIDTVAGCATAITVSRCCICCYCCDCCCCCCCCHCYNSIFDSF